jgi:hypothetical protein
MPVASGSFRSSDPPFLDYQNDGVMVTEGLTANQFDKVCFGMEKRRGLLPGVLDQLKLET